MTHKHMFSVLCTGLALIALSSCASSTSKRATDAGTAGNTGTPTDPSTTSGGGTSTTPSTQSGSTISTMCQVASTNICYENSNITTSAASAASTTCTQQQGTFTSNAACPTDNKVGGCLQSGALTSGSTRAIAWQYSPATEDQIKAACSASNQTFVSPSDIPVYSNGASSTVFAMCNVTAAATCYEYSFLPTAQLSAASTACAAVKGAFTPYDTCPKNNVVGACTQTSGLGAGTTLLNVWQYAPTYTEKQVMDICVAAGETFVAPVVAH